MEARGPEPKPAKRDTPWTLILLGLVAVYAVIVAARNAERVKVDFLFFSASTRLLFLIVLCLGVGFAAGYLVFRFRGGRGRGSGE